MAGVLVEVDTAQMERDIESVKERLQAVRSALETVYAQMEELDAMWDGPANDAFRKQFASDREEFAAMCKEMDSLVESLTYAKWEYEKCESRVNAAVAAIRV